MFKRIVRWLDCTFIHEHERIYRKVKGPYLAWTKTHLTQIQVIDYCYDCRTERLLQTIP